MTTAQIIPKEWRRTKLGDISDVTNGKTNSQDAVADGEYPLFDRSVAIKRSGKYLFDKTAVILPGEGAEFVPRYYSGKFDLHQRVYAIFPYEIVDPLYLFQYLYANRAIFAQKAVGSTVKSLRLPIIQAVDVLLPPLPEQKRIAEILNTVDEEIQRAAEIIATAEKLKKGTMRLLFSRGIKHTKFKKTKLGSIPESWDVVALGDIGTNTIGLTYSPKDVVNEGGTLVFRSSNIKGNTIEYEDKVFVSKQIPTNLITKPGDILLCTRNGSRNLIGKNAYIDEKSAGHSFGAFMSVYRTKYSGFVFQLFQSEFFKTQVNKHLGATINQITTGVLNTFTFVLPPVDEQRKIVDILSSIDQKIVVNRQIKVKLLQLKRGLMRDLLSGKVRTN